MIGRRGGRERMSVKRNDMVVVLAGAHKGLGPARLLAVDNKSQRAIVEGVGYVLKHVKKGSTASQQGGRVSIPARISVSSLGLYCGSCGRAVRYRWATVGGLSARVCAVKGCGKNI